MAGRSWAYYLKFKKMNHLFYSIIFLFVVQSAFGQEKDFLPIESDYYDMVTVPIPEGIVLEGGGVVTMPNGNIGVSTRRGEVWVVENPYMENGASPKFRKFASGLHEILGLAYRDGAFYCAQRGELTKLVDADGDGYADIYEAVFDWPLSGHYHEYSFGPKVAEDGSMYVTGNVAFGDQEWWRGESRVPWRGWTMKISPDGKMEPYAAGMRSPCGIGFVDGAFFYADNQGDWMGSGGLVHVEKGDFTGHPAGLKWAERPDSPVKITENDIYYRANPRFTPKGQPLVKPENIEDEEPLPLFKLAKELPSIKLPAVWLPHGILGISTSEIIVDETKGAFGPFDGQMLIGDQGQSKIVRVFLEKVNGVYQGAAFNFREGFQSGVLRMSWGKDGSLFVGQTNRGWGSTGKDPYGLQRLIWTGKMPFEMKAVRAMPDGFEIEFTQPVDKNTAKDMASYSITGFTYKYHPVYGSPVANQENCPIRGIVVSDDGLKARLVVDNLRQFYIHELKAEGVQSYNGNMPLLHNAAYYTLNEIPEGEKLKLPDPPKVEKPAHQHAIPKPAPAKKEKKATKKKATTAKKAKPKAKKRMAKRPTKMPSSWGKADQTIVISTIPGLKYDQKTLRVKAGSKLKFTFYNNDDMPHNIVIVKPGTADAVGNAALNLGLQGAAMNYIPKSSNVLFHSKLVGPGASDTIYFLAPSKAGAYTYVCTFPGHAAAMRGTLIVQ